MTWLFISTVVLILFISQLPAPPPHHRPLLAIASGSRQQPQLLHQTRIELSRIISSTFLQRKLRFVPPAYHSKMIAMPSIQELAPGVSDKNTFKIELRTQQRTKAGGPNVTDQNRQTMLQTEQRSWFV